MLKLSEPSKNDGYTEILVSFEEGLEPSFAVRAVRSRCGKYDPVVREISTGKMVASRQTNSLFVSSALAVGLHLLTAYLSCKIVEIQAKIEDIASCRCN